MSCLWPVVLALAGQLTEFCAWLTADRQKHFRQHLAPAEHDRSGPRRPEAMGLRELTSAATHFICSWQPVYAWKDPASQSGVPELSRVRKRVWQAARAARQKDDRTGGAEQEAARLLRLLRWEAREKERLASVADAPLPLTPRELLAEPLGGSQHRRPGMLAAWPPPSDTPRSQSATLPPAGRAAADQDAAPAVALADLPKSLRIAQDHLGQPAERTQPSVAGGRPLHAGMQSHAHTERVAVQRRQHALRSVQQPEVKEPAVGSRPPTIFPSAAAGAPTSAAPKALLAGGGLRAGDQALSGVSPTAAPEGSFAALEIKLREMRSRVDRAVSAISPTRRVGPAAR